MDTTSKATQFKAGFFVLLGIISIGALVLYFGRFGDSIKKFYTITVEYRNASGLLKGADVTLSGARIGAVADSPSVLPNMKGVAVRLKIDESVQIPRGSVFSIGDRFVTVTMSEDALDQKAIAPDTVITNGLSESSIADLQRQLHEEILPKLNDALANIDSVSGTLKNKVFNDEGIKNLQATLVNFRTTSETLAASSTQIKGVTDQANFFLKKGNSAMDSMNAAVDDLKPFIINLRQHGILFVADTKAASIVAIATGDTAPAATIKV